MEKKVKIGIFSAILFLSVLGLVSFNMGMFSIVHIDQDIALLSNYIVKAGMKTDISSGTYSGNFIDQLNAIIENGYIVSVFDNPIIFDGRWSGEVVLMMKDVNEKTEGTTDEFGLYFDEHVFSGKLINLVSENSYDILDMFATINELEKSADIFCNGVERAFEELEGQTGFSIWLSLCGGKPDEIFKRDGRKYVLDLNDINVYDDKSITSCRKIITCVAPVALSVQGVICPTLYDPVCGIVDGKMRTFSNRCGACTTGVDMDYFEGECPKYSYERFTSDRSTRERCWTSGYEQEFIGTLELSKLKFEIEEKAGDIVIGIGEDGTNEMDKLEGRFEFPQYSYQIDHSESLGLDNIRFDTVGYIVLSNNEDVVEAGEGNIKEKSRISDLWYGLTTGEVKKSPSTIVNASLGGIAVLMLILIIITLIFG